VIKSVGITVPAHNEEDLLPACLHALRDAAQAIVGVPAHIVVVAANCTDGTVRAATSSGASVISVSARAVGAARAAGMNELLRHFSDLDRCDLWLATTDADTTVPRAWLERQLRYADQGWDAVLGTVTVADWIDAPAHLPAIFAARYEFGEGPHPHVHGANLGIRASAYTGAGGFSCRATAEDHAFVSALTLAGYSVLRAADIAVTTSARLSGRAPLGFSHLLTRLAADAPAPAARPRADAARPRAGLGPASAEDSQGKPG
jgi:glycosyltransferase involved in cell wall biosynthesis